MINLIGALARVATARLLLCPVRIEDPISLAASPAPFDEALLRRFQEDEIDPSPPRRPMVELQQRIEESGEIVGATMSPFMVHRHQCEVADQWAFFEVPGFIGASREALAMEWGNESPALLGAIESRLAVLEIELMRPFFWFQPGKAKTTAYLWEGRLALIHRLLSPVPGAPLHGVAIECF